MPFQKREKFFLFIGQIIKDFIQLFDATQILKQVTGIHEIFIISSKSLKQYIASSRNKIDRNVSDWGFCFDRFWKKCDGLYPVDPIDLILKAFQKNLQCWATGATTMVYQ